MTPDAVTTSVTGSATTQASLGISLEGIALFVNEWGLAMQSSNRALNVSRAFDVYGCKLSRRILDELWQDLNEGASSRATATVSTRTGNTRTGITTREEASLERLWANLRNPDRVTNLDLKVADDAASEMRYCSVSFEPRRARVDVNGSDRTWVRGRAQVIEEKLRSTRGSFPADPEAVYVAAAGAGSASFLLVLYLWLFGIVRGWLILGLLLLAGLAISVISGRWWRRRNATEIVLEERRIPWNRADRISFIATVVAVLSLALAAWQTWGPKH